MSRFILFLAALSASQLFAGFTREEILAGLKAPLKEEVRMGGTHGLEGWQERDRVYSIAQYTPYLEAIRDSYSNDPLMRKAARGYVLDSHRLAREAGDLCAEGRSFALLAGSSDGDYVPIAREEERARVTKEQVALAWQQGNLVAKTHEIAHTLAPAELVWLLSRNGGELLPGQRRAILEKFGDGSSLPISQAHAASGLYLGREEIQKLVLQEANARLAVGSDPLDENELKWAREFFATTKFDVRDPWTAVWLQALAQDHRIFHHVDLLSLIKKLAAQLPTGESAVIDQMGMVRDHRIWQLVEMLRGPIADKVRVGIEHGYSGVIRALVEMPLQQTYLLKWFLPESKDLSACGANAAAQRYLIQMALDQYREWDSFEAARPILEQLTQGPKIFPSNQQLFDRLHLRMRNDIWSNSQKVSALAQTLSTTFVGMSRGYTNFKIRCAGWFLETVFKPNPLLP